MSGFFSKSIERVVCVHWVNHFDDHGLYEVFHSAYSAAFGTTDHEKLKRNTWCILRNMEDHLRCFLSYLKGHVQSVQIGSTFSREQNPMFAAPQGSVLGPVLLATYASLLGKLSRGMVWHITYMLMTLSSIFSVENKHFIIWSAGNCCASPGFLVLR